MFKRVLIANRGVIALRIIRTLKKLGIESIAVYAEVDAHLPHVQQADKAFSLGPGGAAQTYLDQNKILNIAQQEQVDAVHPGYGFLSENAEFCEALEDIDISFIGPTAEQMRLFGLKHTARQLAKKNGVNLLEGSDLLASLDEACALADQITYPVMLKSTAGGGGIGMQVCQSQEQLVQSWDSIKRLSENNFANAGLFLEKYIAKARHVEVQIFGDGKGDIIVLGDRDCSAQRRHQKVLEEAPAPNIPGDIRKALHEQARALMASVCYRNAGTVEFIYDADQDKFYFLEVNTRLQVEHGVTELCFNVDLVEWMLKLAANEFDNFADQQGQLVSRGHALQARLYAENPARNFQPSVGVIQHLSLPEKIVAPITRQDNLNSSSENIDSEAPHLRVDHCLEQGNEVSAFFDPMLAKIMVHAETREQAISGLLQYFQSFKLEGLEHNAHYLKAILADEHFTQVAHYTRFLNDFSWQALQVDVLSAGTMTTIQDYPGRLGYWDVGVPPSGPFDNASFRLGNCLLGNSEGAAGLEITLNGPSLKFNCASEIMLTGAAMDASLDGQALNYYQAYKVSAGQVLKMGRVKAEGARAYLLFGGGLACADYLGSKSTFTLGQFGGLTGAALRTGDVLHLVTASSEQRLEDKNKALEQPVNRPAQAVQLPYDKQPTLQKNWQIRVIYGPHGAPDFFTEEDIQNFFKARWKVHYNSSRTGVRLIGPKPNWARSDGGEAGMHPSNIHDNAYAIGSIDFTGDMPVILGPDGPSLGGFVCPATVISADLWKLGQLKADDLIEFIPISLAQARAAKIQQDKALALGYFDEALAADQNQISRDSSLQLISPILQNFLNEDGQAVVYRCAGDQNILVEYGSLNLDLRLRFRVHALMQELKQMSEHKPLLAQALIDLTPGIRSLQIHYQPHLMSSDELVEILKQAESALSANDDLQLPSRIVHLPLSWNDEQCRLAVQKYMQSVRHDAPWCPDNIEFIRRINGLESVDEVKKIVFDAHYVVMGLGDVYLGAPVATPLDPRHRLVTTKYNPARTWTAENSVGIGGSYLCIYGMEGPGGYQFVGRTLQMWNRHRQTQEFTQPWLLRFFDQIKFYEVSQEELQTIREQFPRGAYPIKIEQTQFSLREYDQFLLQNNESISEFKQKRNLAFEQELQRWVETGQINFAVTEDQSESKPAQALADNQIALESPVSGNVWTSEIAEGQILQEGQVACVLESMKMEIAVHSDVKAKIVKCLCKVGQSVQAGQQLAILEVIASS